MPSRKTINIQNLYLELNNPRHDPVEREAEAINYLCSKESVLELAEDIVEMGLNPLEITAVYSSKGSKTSYIVAEGNRRICALKLLNDPDKAPAKLKGKFEKLATDWHPIVSVPVMVFANREQTIPWRDRLHNGAQGGIGRRQWDSIQKARVDTGGRNRVSLQLLEYAKDRGILSEDEIKGKITTVQRYFGNQKFRDDFGLVKDESENLKRNRNQEDFDILLEVFFDDLSNGVVSSRKNKSDVEAYGETIARNPTISKKLSRSVTLRKPDAKKKTAPKKKKKAKPNKLNTIEHKTEIADLLAELGSSKLQSIYYSICTIRLRSHAPMVAIGSWAFFETLSAKAGRNSQTSFPSFWSNSKLTTYKLGSGKDLKSYRTALEGISDWGDVTKHDADAAAFDGQQIANSMEKLSPLIIACLEEMLEDK